MRTMMTTMLKQIINILLLSEALVLSTLFYSKIFFINAQVAFLSSLFIIIGASFAYKKMIDKKVNSKEYEAERDLLESIEDPHELYSEEKINEAPAEELDLKTIVKEEKAKIKTLSVKNMKYGAKASASLFRVVPYILLVLGFIALENNNLLDLTAYLPSLLLGIVTGVLVFKELAF